MRDYCICVVLVVSLSGASVQRSLCLSVCTSQSLVLRFNTIYNEDTLVQQVAGMCPASY